MMESLVRCGPLPGSGIGVPRGSVGVGSARRARGVRRAGDSREVGDVEAARLGGFATDFVARARRRDRRVVRLEADLVVVDHVLRGLADLRAHRVAAQRRDRVEVGAPGLVVGGVCRDRAEREYICMTLKGCDWNISRAAALLGVERTNLHKKMRALGIHRAD